MEVTAPALESLFEEAARSLFDLLGGVLPSDTPRTITIDLEGADTEELLIRWLSELLARHESAGEALEGFSVRFPAPGRLEGTARTGTAAAGPTREIKAVTYHAVSVNRGGAGWTARFVLDV